MNEFLKPFLPPEDNAPLHICLAGVTYPDPSYHTHRPASDVAVIEYITDGEGYVEINGQLRPVCKDMIYFLPQGADHRYFADQESPFTKIFMNISGPLCEQLVAAFGLTGKLIFGGHGLKSLFEEITVIIHSDMSEVEMQCRLQGLLTEIISRLSVAVAETRYSDEALALKNFLDMNIDRSVSAAELSKIVFRSPDYCQKLFLREFGITPYAYQLDRKLQKAKFLLSYTKMAVGEVARAVGYDDLHYFSNLFLSKCGCRPTVFRKNNGNTR